MMPGRSQAASAAISLFPFLAVLICTMGVMIILLVVASKAAEEHCQATNASAQQQLSDQKEQLDFEVQSEELKIDVLMRSRPELQRRLDQARMRRSHVENELRELERRFKESLALSAEPVQDEAPERTDPSSLESLQRRVTDAERELVVVG